MNENIIQINHKQLETFVTTAYEANTPLMVWGAPGIGKSTVIRAVAEKISASQKLQFFDWNKTDSKTRMGLSGSLDNKGKFIYADCRLAQYDPSDWAIPWKSNDDGAMVWLPSSLLKAFAVEGTSGLLFLDELPQAQPAVQNSAYQIILDRGYKDTAFPNIRVIAAGNRSSDGGSQYAFAPALANRLNHVELTTPSGKDWVKSWATGAGINPFICAFITRFPDQLYETTGATENRRYAWASPRSWEAASKLLNTMEAPNARNIETWVSRAADMLYTSVGRGASLDFMAFMKVLNDVFLEDFIKDPEKIKDVGVDKQLGLISLLAYELAQEAKKADRVDEKHRLIAAALDMHKAISRAEFKYLLLHELLHAWLPAPQSKISPILLAKKDKAHNEYLTEQMCDTIKHVNA